jgi:hypothetical protein
MITGAHVIIYSTNPDADRAFLRDVLTLTNVNVGATKTPTKKAHRQLKNSATKR